MDPERRNKANFNPYLVALVGAVAVLVGSFAQDWFPDVEPLLVTVIAAVVVGLVALVVQVLVRRARRR